LSRKVISFLIPILFLIQIIGVHGLFVDSSQQINVVDVLQQNIVTSEQDFLLPTGAGGESPLLSSIISNGQMEEANADNGPEGFGYWGSTYKHIDSTYQLDVHSGSYASYIAGKGTPQSGSSAQNYRYLNDIPQVAYLDQLIYLDFWYKALANPDIATGGQIYFTVRVYTISTSYYLYYFLSDDNFFHSNNTNTAFFDIRSSLGSWINVQRNLTLDFEETFGSASNPYVLQLYFYAYSPVSAIAFTEFIIDDVSVTNSTTFEYLSNNGDFETGTGNLWTNSSEGPGSAQITTSDFTEGEKALNMTAYAYFDNSYGYETLQSAFYVGDYPPQGYYATAPGDFVISFDWKYNDTISGGGNQNAYIYIQAQNATTLVYLYYYLGEHSDIVPSYNYTDPSFCEYYFGATNFGSRNVWNTQIIDLYTVLSALNLNDFSILCSYISVTAGFASNSKVTLLIDNYQITTYPMGDPSFEQDWYWSSDNPLVSWSENKDDNYVHLTSEAHTGDHALNLSAYNSVGYVTTYRNCYLPVTYDMFTDYWWKIDAVDDQDSLVAFEISFNDYYVMTYILGSSSDILPSNNSAFGYYYADNYNKTGEWFNLVRNIYDDASALFGVNDYRITRLTQYCFASGSGIVTKALFDDLHYVLDASEPEVSNVWYEHTPVYYQDTAINIQVHDALSDISSVIIHYWDTVDWFTSTTVDLGGGHYRGLIPMDDYGAQYNFYINSTDEFGNYDLTGVYYFMVGDDINPEGTISSPSNLAVVSDTVTITVDCSDEGSGIDKVEFYVDSSLDYTDSTGTTYTYDLDTTLLTDGYHNIDVYTYDNYGNWAVDGITINVQNAEPTPTPTPTPTPSPSPSETSPLFGGIISLLAIPTIAFIVVKYYKKKQ